MRGTRTSDAARAKVIELYAAGASTVDAAAGAGVRVPNRLRQQSSEKLSAAMWSGIGDVLPLLRWLYPPGDYLQLRRKRERADEYLANPPTHRTWAPERWSRFSPAS